MSNQIIKQPNGKWCIWSSVVDAITVYEATEEEIIEEFAEMAAEEVRRTVKWKFDYIKANPDSGYFQFTVTFEEALAGSDQETKDFFKNVAG